MSKRYSDVRKLETFEERFEFLKLNGKVGDPTFGGHRYVNQVLYKSEEWKKVKRRVILRDRGFDLAVPYRDIFGPVLVHHIEPITLEDILERRAKVFDPENLICVSFDTHNALHYGGEDSLNLKGFIERALYDTCPWR